MRNSVTNRRATAGKLTGMLVLSFFLFLPFADRCAAGNIIEFPIPKVGANPEGITFGPDGAYWFVQFRGDNIGRITTNGAITEFPISPNSYPIDITTGPDTNLWFTESLAGKVGRITTNGVVTEFPLPPGVIGEGITLGPDGRLWIADFGQQLFIPGMATNGGIIALTIDSNGPTATNYYNAGLTVGGRPLNITTGPDGNLWFTEGYAGKIGRITPGGVITEFPLPVTNCSPYDIITGPDGALWFTEYGANRLGRITTSGVITEFDLPANTIPVTPRPYGLVTGPDGNIWYTDEQGGHVSRVELVGTNINVTQFFPPTTNAFPKGIATGSDGNIWFGEFPFNTTGTIDGIGKVVLIPPVLTIQATNTNQVVISWPTNATTNFVLQGNTNLTTSNWVNLTNVVVATNGLFVVTHDATNNLFFRLKLFP